MFLGTEFNERESERGREREREREGEGGREIRRDGGCVCVRDDNIYTKKFVFPILLVFFSDTCFHEITFTLSLQKDGQNQI